MTSTPPCTATRLEDLTWVEFEELAPETPYWILVTGSTEQHGPHLPLGADTLVAERLAEVVAAEHGALILGSVRAGVLHAFQDWPGSQRVPHQVLVGTATTRTTSRSCWPPGAWSSATTSTWWWWSGRSWSAT